jgi:hypothetical protein
MDETIKAVIILAMHKPLREFVCPLYMRTIEEMAESEDKEKAIILRDTASVIERIGILRDKGVWCEFMQSSVNPSYQPQEYFQI